MTNAITLDGSTQYGTVSNFSGIDALNGNITIEGWFWNDPSSQPYAYAASINGASYGHAQIQTENATPSDGINFGVDYANGATNADGYNSTGIFDLSTWVHIALVGTLNNVSKVYKNGVEISYTLQNSPSGSLNSASGYPFTIGLKATADANGHNWTGKVGGFVRLWNTARTAAQIKQNMWNHLNIDHNPNLIVNLKFKEGSGTTIADSADKNGNRVMNLTATPPWTTGPDILELSSAIYPLPIKNNLRPRAFGPGLAR
jgi:hypothetical protein